MVLNYEILTANIYLIKKLARDTISQPKRDKSTSLQKLNYLWIICEICTIQNFIEFHQRGRANRISLQY